MQVYTRESLFEVPFPPAEDGSELATYSGHSNRILVGVQTTLCGAHVYWMALCLCFMSCSQVEAFDSGSR